MVKTDRTCLLWHPDRKRRGSILTTPESTQSQQCQSAEERQSYTR